MSNAQYSNKAIELAKESKWNEAWEMAQCDTGLASGATFASWKAWAEKAIARRKREVA